MPRSTTTRLTRRNASFAGPGDLRHGRRGARDRSWVQERGVREGASGREGGNQPRPSRATSYREVRCWSAALRSRRPERWQEQEANRMEYRDLGRTGLRVSEIGFGAWAVGGDAWGPVEDADSLAVM